MIHYMTEEGIELPEIDKSLLSRWIRIIASNYNKKVGEITYVFCNDSQIIGVNNQFLNHDYYTDIITFDYGKANLISGEIFISLDTVASNAAEFKITFEKELYRVIIHGVLHLCGQDDETEKLRFEMISKENLALDQLINLSN